MKRMHLFFMLFCAVTSALAEDTVFSQQPVPQAVQQRMTGKSRPADCPVDWEQLRYLQISHHDGHGKVALGEMVCHRSIAARLVAIFRELYLHNYPIERMQLIDDFNADDELSMQANNTSCFCYRRVAGSARLSAHSRGMAVDINPLYNPCVRTRNGRRTVQPRTAKQWTDRSLSSPYIIRSGDLLHRLMTENGFQWGGSWRSVKDYQHFEYKGNL